MLDATPLATTLWDENLNRVDCNNETLRMFGANTKQEFLDRFYDCFPENQPDGRLTTEMAAENLQRAFVSGYGHFEIMLQRFDGEPLPADMYVVRVEHKGKITVVSYARDLREIKKSDERRQEADARARIMFDATPMCCHLWNENLEIIDCNQGALDMFGFTDREEYMVSFEDLSPEFQPDGSNSKERAHERLESVFKKKHVVFEWLHLSKTGEPIPAEVTLVSSEREGKSSIASYIRDLREITASIERLGHLETLAFTDTGTDTFNRRYFLEKAEQSFFFNQVAGHHAIIMIDLDSFKHINDTYGHLAGDKVLNEIAIATKSALRPEDLFARYGGDEFIVMVRETKPGISFMLAERIRNTVANMKIEYEGYSIKTTASIGVALQTEDDEKVEDVLRRADARMYHAKRSGKNQIISVD